MVTSSGFIFSDIVLKRNTAMPNRATKIEFVPVMNGSLAGCFLIGSSTDACKPHPLVFLKEHRKLRHTNPRSSSKDPKSKKTLAQSVEDGFYDHGPRCGCKQRSWPSVCASVSQKRLQCVWHRSKRVCK
jgi:hypothetical protein